jgi:hypothetical protein
VIGPTESVAADRRRRPEGRAAVGASASLRLSDQQKREAHGERPGESTSSPCHSQSPLLR